MSKEFTEVEDVVSDEMTVTLVLTGAREGKSVRLQKRLFTNGKFVYSGSQKQVHGLSKYFGRTYQAYPEGSRALQRALAKGNKNGQRDLETNGGAGQVPNLGSDGPPRREGPSEVSPDGGGGSVDTASGRAGNSAGGDGPANTGNDGASAEQDRLHAALKSLDPKNVEHWTETGLPRLDAVQNFFGRSVTRAEVRAVAPDFVRG